MPHGGPLGVTFASLGVLGPAACTEVAVRADALGYHSFWTSEANATDAVSLLGAVRAMAPRLDVGTGIVPIQLRSPALVAMTAATLQQLAPQGEVLVGVGTSTPVVAGQWHGSDATDRPLARAREYLVLLRELLSGDAVTFEGDFWTVRRFQLGVRYTDERRPRIVLAALNPAMLRLAGGLADAVLLNYLPASHVPASVAEVRKGGQAQVYAYVHAAVADREPSLRSARRDLFSYVMADGYARMFADAGFGDEVAAAQAAMAERDRDGAVAAISERMAFDIDFVGDADQVAAHIRAYRDGGVDHPVLMPLPWGEDRRAVTDATMVAAVSA
jgi:probable F420-dependent oxidoreductase